MVRLPLSRGLFALVDDEDAHLARFKWSASGRAPYIYAVRRAPGGGVTRLHREILHAPAGVHVDHLNGNGLDCRRDNLRLATRRQNMANRKLNRDNTSGFKGVYQVPKSGRWLAQIRVSPRNLYLGTFATAEEAARAYDAAARRHFGEFARPNFSQSKEEAHA